MQPSTSPETVKLSREPVAGEGVRAAKPCRSQAMTQSEHKIELCECILDITAAMFNVSGRELRKPGRSTLDVSRARQIAMYTCHVSLGLHMTDVGAGFGRDRTTVMHACHTVEDLRDDKDFDAVVSAFERIAVAAFKYRDGVTY